MNWARRTESPVPGDRHAGFGRGARETGQQQCWHRARVLPHPGSTGTSEIRIIFAFDPQRRAILLVAGDKTGNWRQWYTDNIPLADDRFDEHLADLSKPERRGGDR